jgi:hypothetical protein
VKYGVLVNVNYFARNPSAEMRGGFLRCGAQPVVPRRLACRPHHHQQQHVSSNRDAEMGTLPLNLSDHADAWLG